MLALLSFAGCSGDDSPDDEEATRTVETVAPGVNIDAAPTENQVG